jgi:hypothetical protein
VQQAYTRSRRSASRILDQVFDLKGATGLGGLNALARFLRRLGIDGKLSDRFRATKARWSRWRLDRILRVLLDAHFAGIERLYHFEDLETEPLLCAQQGVDRLPDLKTLYRDLRRFEEPVLLDSLHGLMRDVVTEALANQKRIVLEIDSTVEPLYGSQEGAEIGPNPHKPGRPSYHPLLARDRISDLIVHHVLRPGDASSAKDIKTFVHKTIDIVRDGGQDREILARLDAGFETFDTLEVLERRRVGYVVKMRASHEVARYVASLPRDFWRRIPWDEEGEIQVTSSVWRRAGWDRPRRIVAVRKREMDNPQGRLFDEAGWFYSLYVTNLDWAPEEIARFYDKRADVERTICEAKNDLSIDHVPTANFAANAADLALKILARNLLVLYRDHGLCLGVRYRVMTLRRRFLWVAGRLVRRGGRLVLRLAATSHLRPALQAQPLRS